MQMCSRPSATSRTSVAPSMRAGVVDEKSVRPPPAALKTIDPQHATVRSVSSDQTAFGPATSRSTCPSAASDITLEGDQQVTSDAPCSAQ